MPLPFVSKKCVTSQSKYYGSFWGWVISGNHLHR